MVEVDAGFCYRLMHAAAISDLAARTRRRERDERIAYALATMPDVHAWLEQVCSFAAGAQYVRHEKQDAAAVVSWSGEGEQRSLSVTLDQNLWLIEWTLFDGSARVRATGRADPRRFQDDLQDPLLRLCDDAHWLPPDDAGDDSSPGLRGEDAKRDGEAGELQPADGEIGTLIGAPNGRRA